MDAALKGGRLLASRVSPAGVTRGSRLDARIGSGQGMGGHGSTIAGEGPGVGTGRRAGEGVPRAG